ncbi:hypothetical protein ACFYXH_22770 [Streptomyces sp. NPDC002730]|uniref:hypothetical protein n=1 Tax=Streptomyces sp. NPDC002730 TaxID=3364662 RepID=UPI0036B5E23A
MKIRRKLAVLVGGLALTVMPLAPAQAESTPPPTPVPAAGDNDARGFTPADADAYWTPERMRAAQPVEGGKSADGPVPRGLLASPSKQFEGIPIVGTFFFSDGTNTGRFCGGTVVNSPGKNLVMRVAADRGLALSLADADRLDLLAEVAEPGRGHVAALADRAVLGDGVRRSQLPAMDALVFRPGVAAGTEERAVLAADVGRAVAAAPGAVLPKQRIFAEAASADGAVLALSDDVAVLTAACAGPELGLRDAPAAAAAFRGDPGKAKAGAVAARAGQLGDGVAVPGGFEVLEEPDHLDGAVR